MLQSRGRLHRIVDVINHDAARDFGYAGNNIWPTSATFACKAAHGAHARVG
jgi:hypothetical protein